MGRVCDSHDVVVCDIQNLKLDIGRVHDDLKHIKWLLTIIIVQTLGLGGLTVL